MSVYLLHLDTPLQHAHVTEAMELKGEEQEIVDDSDLRKYRIELPNLYDDSDLDPYAFRLLAHYKRVGTCTESTKTTARKTKMSPAQVSVKRQELSEKGFILLVKVPLKNAEFSYRINVVDLWKKNFETYSPHERPYSPHERPIHHMKQRSNNIKKKPQKEVKAAKPPTPPEIALYREVTERYPKRIAFDEVVSAVQKVSARLGRPCTKDDLLPFYKTWLTKSNNEYNFSVWLLLWAVQGKITNGWNNANTTANHAQSEVSYSDDDRRAAELILQRRAV